MLQKEGMISNFNVDKDKVTLFINPRIFPISSIHKAASEFKDRAWVSVDGSPDTELLIDIKPKGEYDLELLAREFNSRLIELSADVKINQDDKALVSRIKQIVHNFVSDEKGRISKQSILALGTILAGMGLGAISIEDVSASHLCACTGDSCGDGCTCNCASGLDTCMGGSGPGPGAVDASGTSTDTGSTSADPGASSDTGSTGGIDPGEADPGGADPGGSDSGCGGCSGCGGDSGCGCFLKDALILTIAGEKTIQSIKENDKVISYDESNGIFITSTVGKVIIHDGIICSAADFSKAPLLELKVKIKNKVICTKVTDNHPYFDPIGKKYRQLKDFKIGELIKTVEGNAEIAGKEIIIDENSPMESRKEIVYNLHMMEGPHNYIANGAVVHNKL